MLSATSKAEAIWRLQGPDDSFRFAGDTEMAAVLGIEKFVSLSERACKEQGRIVGEPIW